MTDHEWRQKMSMKTIHEQHGQKEILLSTLYAFFLDVHQKRPLVLQQWYQVPSPQSPRRNILLAPAFMFRSRVPPYMRGSATPSRPPTPIPRLPPPPPSVLRLASPPSHTDSSPFTTPPPPSPPPPSMKRHVTFQLPTIPKRRADHLSTITVDWEATQVNAVLEYRASDDHVLVKFKTSWVSIKHLRHCMFDGPRLGNIFFFSS